MDLEELENTMVNGEHLAFDHAAKLCREYREQIYLLKVWLFFTTSVALTALAILISYWL